MNGPTHEPGRRRLQISDLALLIGSIAATLPAVRILLRGPAGVLQGSLALAAGVAGFAGVGAFASWLSGYGRLSGCVIGAIFAVIFLVVVAVIPARVVS